MAILKFIVKGQTLMVESKIDRIVENSINYLDYEISCDDENWADLAKKVVVTYNKKAYEIFGDKIPSQVIHTPGFTVSIIGYKGAGDEDSGIIVTTYPVAVKVFPSGATEGTVPEDTAIDLSTAEQLNEKIESLNYQTNEKIDNLNEQTNEKIDDLNEQTNEKIDSLEEKIDNEIQSINGDIKDLNDNFTQSLNNIIQKEQSHGVILLNELDKTEGLISEANNGESWYITPSYYHVLLPVTQTEEEKTIVLTGSSSGNGQLAFFSEKPTINSSTVPPYVEGTGLYLLSKERQAEYIIPKGTKYIYLLCSYLEENRLPIKFEINGYDYCKGITENIVKVEERCFNIEDKIDNKIKEINDVLNPLLASNEELQADRVRTITETCHIADLEEGAYVIKMDTEDIMKTKVILSNMDQLTGEYKENYCYSYGGLLTVSTKTIEETDEKVSSVILFNASGFIVGPAFLSIWDDIDGNNNPIHSEEYTSFNDPLDLTGFVLCEKFKTNAPDGKEIDKWYCSFDEWISPFSSVPVSAIRDKIYIDYSEDNLRTHVPSSLAVKNYVESNTSVKTITEPTHIGELDVGTYVVNGIITDLEGQAGKVIIQNINSKGEIDENYFTLYTGIITITDKVIVHDNDEEEMIILSFFASGTMVCPNKVSYDVDVEYIETLEYSSSITGLGLECIKPKVDNPDKGYVAGQWYSSTMSISTGDIPTEALTETIDSESTRFEVPTAKATYDYAEAKMNKLSEYSDLATDESYYSAKLINNILQSTKEEIENKTIKTFNETVNLWELETGIYYLENGYYSKSNLYNDDNEKHIFLIYKPIPSKNAVRYIHFCGNYQKDVWSSIECGYTNGENLYEYSILDGSKVTNNIAQDAMGVLIPNSAAVKSYAETKANKSIDLEADRESTEKYPNVADILQYIDKRAIKVITERVNLWELDTGIYYLDGGWSYTEHLGSSRSERHVFTIYKAGINAVRFIHFCGDYSKDTWSRIGCGYTNGDEYTEYYVIDASQVTNKIQDGLLATQIPNSAAVKNYVKDYVDSVMPPLAEEVEY